MYMGHVRDVRYDSVRNQIVAVYDVIDGDDVVSSRELSWEAQEITMDNIRREIHAGRVFLGATLGMRDHYPW